MEYLLLILVIGAAAGYLLMPYLGWDGNIDPVCGMKVDPESTYQTVYRGRMYRFCTDSCRRKFREQPRKWLETRATDFMDE